METFSYGNYIPCLQRGQHSLGGLGGIGLGHVRGGHLGATQAEDEN